MRAGDVPTRRDEVMLIGQHHPPGGSALRPRRVLYPHGIESHPPTGKTNEPCAMPRPLHGLGHADAQQQIGWVARE